MFVRFTVILTVVFLLDISTYVAISPVWWKGEMFKYIFWVLNLVVYLLFALAILTFKDFRHNGYRMPFISGGIILTVTVPKLILLTLGLVDRFMAWIIDAAGLVYNHLVMHLGLALAVLLALGFLYGMIRGKSRYKVRNVALNFDHLPAGFDGYKLVQISDIHIGSFLNNHAPVKKAIELINKQEADAVLFTGDMVNNFARELAGWEEVFAKIKAKDGKWAVLGNHDYGDYLQWENIQEKQANLDELKERIEKSGFRLLLNESVSLVRKGEAIDILGVENWGLPPFKQYGDLDVTLAKSNAPFKVLMSHDPSHWDVHGKDQDIALTLSGHTHGMQFGFELGKFKWSPVKYKYRKWAGLYKENNSYLYVNRGFGYIGYPGRLGIWPEITVITLKAKR